MGNDRVLAWVVRVVWLTLPFAAGPAFADALDGASDAVRTLCSVGLWAAWGLVLVATVVPRPVGLTALRVAAPASVAAVAAAAAGGHVSVPGLIAALAATLLALLPEVGALFVNGGAYPNERRFPLRVPAALSLGLLPLAWLLAVAGVVTGPLLLAAEQWVAGAVAIAAGFPIAYVMLRSLHTLSRRWAVLVPAGLVLHDPMALLDPVLFRRQVIETLRPAPADTDSLDLTGRALGLALELVLTEKVEMVLLKPRSNEGEAGASARLLFTPARPGALLAAARDQRIPVPA